MRFRALRCFVLKDAADAFYARRKISALRLIFLPTPLMAPRDLPVVLSDWRVFFDAAIVFIERKRLNMFY